MKSIITSTVVASTIVKQVLRLLRKKNLAAAMKNAVKKNVRARIVAKALIKIVAKAQVKTVVKAVIKLVAKTPLKNVAKETIKLVVSHRV